MYLDLIYLLSEFSEVHFGKTRHFQTFLLWIWFQHVWEINECIFSCFFMSRTYNFRNYFAFWEAWLFLCHLVLITLYEIIGFIMSLGISNSIRNKFSRFFSSERKQYTDCLMNVEKYCVVLPTHICHNIILTVFCSQILLNSTNTRPRQWGVGSGWRLCCQH